MSLLRVRNLSVSFTQDGATTQAVKNVSFEVGKGETVALVGESGSGKSVTALSTVALLPPSAEVTGSVQYDGAEMIGADEAGLRKVRGNDISFIFQEPMTSLNPLHTIEKQLAESLSLHRSIPPRSIWKRWAERLAGVQPLRLLLLFGGALAFIYSYLAFIAFAPDAPSWGFFAVYVTTDLPRALLRAAIRAAGVTAAVWVLSALCRTLLGPWIRSDASRAEVLDLLKKVGIDEAESRLTAYPHQLSGGQRQRVMIAMALANRPELLVADEPTTALDVTIQAQILDLLADLKASEQMSLLFITHDLGIVRRFADRVCVMQNGEIVAAGRTDEIFANPRHPYTQTLLAAEPKGEPEPVPTFAEEVVRTDALRVWFPIQRGLLRKTVGHVKAVNEATLSVRQGETLGVVGESGSGKTTLALAILRLLSSQGRISFQGRELQGLSSTQIRPLRKDMQVVFQDPYGSLSPRMTVEQIVAEGLSVHRVTGDHDRTQLVADILTEVGLDPAMMHRYPHEFSGGQRQRIAIARAMILNPRLVVLDEPTSALDMTVQVQIVELLRKLQKKHDLAYLFISHDLKVVRALSHKVIVMKQGDIVEAGTNAEIFGNPRTDYTRQLMAAAFDLHAKGTG